MDIAVREAQACGARVLLGDRPFEVKIMFPIPCGTLVTSRRSWVIPPFLPCFVTPQARGDPVYCVWFAWLGPAMLCWHVCRHPLLSKPFTPGDQASTCRGRSRGRRWRRAAGRSGSLAQRIHVDIRQKDVCELRPEGVWTCASSIWVAQRRLTDHPNTTSRSERNTDWFLVWVFSIVLLFVSCAFMFPST